MVRVSHRFELHSRQQLFNASCNNLAEFSYTSIPHVGASLVGREPHTAGVEPYTSQVHIPPLRIVSLTQSYTSQV